MNYPYQEQAKELESFGRYGDTMLVHMNPAEVAGIASLMPGGEMTINPHTGQPEAFAFLIPLLASGIGAAAGWGTIGTAALSGAMTAAATGDLKRGLASAVMGAGVGSALGAAGEVGADAAAEAAAEAAIAGTGEGVATQSLLEGGIGDIASNAIDVLPAEQAVASAAEGAGSQLATAATQQAPTFGQSAMTNLKNTFTGAGGKEILPQLTKQQHLLPIALGGGQLEAMEQQEDWDKQAKKLAQGREEDEEAAYNRNRGYLQSGYAAAGHQPGRSPYRRYMSSGIANMPGGYASGGMIKYQGKKYRQEDLMELLNNRYGGGSTNNGYDGIDPVTVQKNLRHTYVPAPAGYQHGFAPEFQHFQNLSPDAEGNVPEPNIPAQRMPGPDMGMYSSNINRFMTQAPEDKKAPPMNSRAKKKGMAEGGNVELNTSLGPMEVAGGGIAELPTEFTEQGPSEQDIQMVAMAVMKGGDQADQIINGFIERYGVETFRAVREMILKAAGGGGAQTEGMIKGPGGGMDDKVMGTIGGEQGVAVSPGEYIVPADVVSGLGDGSSDAGASELDQMSDRVRMARGGTTTQPQPFDAAGVLPV